MTEHEELEKNTKQQYMQQRVDELGKYLDVLTERIDETVRRERDSFLIYMIVWASWVTVGFFDTFGDQLFEMFFIIALIYSSYRTSLRAAAAGEFRGAIKTLDILGMIPPMGGGRERKRRRTWREGADIVKGWFTKKQKAKDEVYAPA